MRVLVNGVRLFFYVEGTKLVPNGPAMRERPTLLLLRPRRRSTRILCNSNGFAKLPACGGPRCARTGHGGDPGLHRTQMSKAAKTRPAPEGAG
jgi:hypothetical protein